MKKPLALLFLGMCILFFLPAQELKIVKDNINCTYGLKNANGKWVIPADYVSIYQDDYGYYKLKTENTEGLASAKGKIILKADFQYVNPFRNQSISKQERWQTQATEDFFLVWKNGLAGLHNSKGKEVFPIRYRRIVFDEWPDVILLKEKDGNFVSKYCNVFGKIHFKIKGCLGYFDQKEYAVVGDDFRDNFHFGITNAGLIKKNGKWFIPPSYDQINVNRSPRYNYPESYRLKLNEKTILLDEMGKEIEGQKYKVHYPSHPDEDLTKLDSNKIYVIHKNNLFGLMKGDGQLLIEPKFSKLEKQWKWRDQKSRCLWLTYNDKNQVGIISSEGELILETIYESIQPQPFYQKQADGSTILRHHIIFIQNGKYGLMSSEGEVIEKAVNDSYHYVSETFGYFGFFSKGLELKTYDFASYPAQPTNLPFFVRTDHFALYKLDLSKIDPNKVRRRNLERYFFSFLIKDSILKVDQRSSAQFMDSLLIVSTDKRKYVLHKNGSFINGEANLEFGKVYGSGQRFNKKFAYLYANGKVGLIDLKSNKVLVPIKYESISLTSEENATVRINEKYGILNIQSGEFFVKPRYSSIGRAWSSYLKVSNDNGLFGVLDPESEKWIIEPKYLDFQFGMVPEGFIMAKIAHADKSLSYECGKWIMINPKGKQLSTIEFDNPDIYKKPQLAQSNNHVGWFDPMAKKWIIPPNYSWMHFINDSLAQVATDSLKYGLIHLNGNLLIDTNYSCMKPIFLSTNYYSFHGPLKNMNCWWEYSNKTERVLLNEKGEIFNAGKEQDSILFRSAFVGPKKFNPDSNLCHECFKITVSEDHWETFWKMPYLKELYNSYQNKYSNKQPCHVPRSFSNCKKIDNYSTVRGSRYGPENYSLLFANDYALSVQRSWHNPLDRGIASGPTVAWDNYWVRTGKLESMDLMDLVGNSNILYKEYTHALENRDDLNLDCQNNEQLLQIINQHWSLDKKGVQLYFYSNFGSYRGTVIIPWTQLARHKETKEVANLFLKNNK